MTTDAAFGWSGPRSSGAAEPRPWSVGSPTFRADTFDRPRRASPWAGHRWFAYDLIQYQQPRRIAELGTHYGCSFFAFCDAVRDHGIDSEVIAVDTWEGDEHAGFYDDVFELVSGWVDDHYDMVDTRLIRSTFDAAVDQIEPASVDLLHIDGYHSYEAAAHDHESWRDRLSPFATVLFHDVDPASGYGSADYWRELAGREGGWTFLHSFGLGVLTRDSELVGTLSSEAFAQLGQVYPARAAADLAAMQVEDLSEMVSARQTVIERQDALISDKDGTIADQAAFIDQQGAALLQQAALIADRDLAIADQAAIVDAKQAIIEHQDFLIADRDEAIAAQAQLVDAKQAIIDQQNVAITERDRALAERNRSRTTTSTGH